MALLESMSAAKQCGGQHKFPAKHITRIIHENLSHHLLVPSVSWCRLFEIFLTVFIIGLIKYIERLGRRAEGNKVPNHFPWCVEKIQANNLQMAFFLLSLGDILFFGFLYGTHMCHDTPSVLVCIRLCIELN